MTDLRLGRWQVVLATVERCDSLICDPPYSNRTTNGYRSGSDISDDSGIDYGCITERDARELACSWAEKVERWAVIFCDHVAFRWHEAAWRAANWYTFAPVGWVKRGAPPRLRGDGPASQMDHILVARPRNFSGDGHKPGWYLVETPRVGHGAQGVTGNKDPQAMRALIRDYSRRGDLVVDPFCGSGTTAMACAIEERRCITSECDTITYAIAQRRLAAGYTAEMWPET